MMSEEQRLAASIAAEAAVDALERAILDGDYREAEAQAEALSAFVERQLLPARLETTVASLVRATRRLAGELAAIGRPILDAAGRDPSLN